MDEARKKKLIWQLPFLTLLIVGTILIIRQQQATPYQKNSGLIFGTTYNITYQHDDDLHKEILDKLKEVDATLLKARLVLIETLASVLRKATVILGISLPDRM